jgi:hypothetical protein
VSCLSSIVPSRISAIGYGAIAIGTPLLIERGEPCESDEDEEGEFLERHVSVCVSVTIGSYHHVICLF